jgi:hypothetical protein
MPAYIIALNIKSRYRRPDVGAFQWMDAYNRHVWKQMVAEDTETLARLANEALAFMRAWDQMDMHIEIVAVDAVRDFTESFEPAIEADSPVRKKRKLLPTLPD